MKNEHAIWKRFAKAGRFAAAALLLILLGSSSYRAEDAEKTVYYYLTDEMEFSPAAACGVLGNIAAESGFRPDIYAGGAYGLCQWMEPRLSRLQSFCRTKGLDYSSAYGQAAFIEYELKKFYPHVYYYLRGVGNSAAGAYDAAYYWCKYFEIPANREYQAQRRGGIARAQYWPKYGINRLYLSAAAQGDGILLTWRNANASRLAILRSEQRDGTYARIAVVSAEDKSYLDSTALRQKKYYYYVCPFRKKQEVSDERSNRLNLTFSRTLSDADCAITLSRTRYTYNGKPKKPEVSVTYAGRTLRENRDYTVTYKKNVHAGRGVVLLQGKGSFQGAVRKRFRIEKAEPVITIRDMRIAWTRKSVRPQVKVKGEKTFSYTLAADKALVAVGKGKKLYLKGSGVTVVTAEVAETADHLAGTKTFRLAVLPGIPRVTRVHFKKGVLTAAWKCAGRPDGYEVAYTSKRDFTDGAVQADVAGRAVKTIRIPELNRKKTWTVRVRSYKIKENGKRLYSEWSRVRRQE